MGQLSGDGKPGKKTIVRVLDLEFREWNKNYLS